MPHFGVIGWTVIVLAVTVVIAGVGSAATMGRTIAGTGGNVGGILVGGLPVFFDKFGEGINAMTKDGGGSEGATFTFDQQQRQQPQRDRAIRDRRDGGQLAATRNR